MSFLEDVGMLLGFEKHKEKMEEFPTYAKRHSDIDIKTEKFWEKLSNFYLKIDEETGETLAEKLHDANHPDWFWLEDNAPPEVLKKIKKESNITD